MKTENAKDFLKTANITGNEIWSPFMEVLFTATEFAIRSIFVANTFMGILE